VAIFRVTDKAAWEKRLEWNDEHYEEIVKDVAITGF